MMSEEIVAQGVLNTNPGSVVAITDKRLAKPWDLSAHGISFIATLESGVFNGKFRGYEVKNGMILEVYDDGKGNPTVGLGHLVISQDKLNFGDKVTLEWAERTAKKDFSRFVAAVNKKVIVPLLQHEFDALVSIAFNVGEYGGFSGMASFLNTGAYEKAPVFIRSYRAKGIEWRRDLEARLFESGNYDGTHGKSANSRSRDKILRKK